VTDPRNLLDNNPANDNQIYNVTIFSGGNPSVKPEKADTWTAGVVFNPSFFHALSVSVDWYDIKINDAIGQVGTQSVVNRCLGTAPEQEFCNLITLNNGSLDGALVGDVYVNVARSEVSGVDAEIDFNTPVKLLGGGDESLSARAFGSWLTKRSDTNSAGVTTDYAGETGAIQGTQVYYPYPDFKATGSITYRNGGWSFLTQARYIAPGIQDICAVQLCPGSTTLVAIKDNRVDPVLYIDLRLGFDTHFGAADAEFFMNVTNLFDTDPPITPSYSAFAGYATQYNPSVYDVLGRRYTAGVKLKF